MTEYFLGSHLGEMATDYCYFQQLRQNISRHSATAVLVYRRNTFYWPLTSDVRQINDISNGHYKPSKNISCFAEYKVGERKTQHNIYQTLGISYEYGVQKIASRCR